MAEVKKVNGKAQGAEDRRIPKRAAYQLQDAKVNRWHVLLPAEATVEDLKDPTFFALAPKGTNAYDIFWMIGKDFVAEVLVRDYLLGSLQPVVLRVVPLPPRQQDGSDRWSNLFNVTHDHEQGWVVTRKSDGAVLGTERNCGWQNKEQAIRFGLDHAGFRQQAR